MIHDKKILITGGLGFIGSNLVSRYQNTNEVTVLDSCNVKSGYNEHNATFFNRNVDIIRSPISKIDDPDRFINIFDIIINCAATTSHPNSMIDPLNDLNSNVRDLVLLLNAVKNSTNNPRIIHFGTTTQMGVLQRTPADESHKEFPLDIYSANKLLSEKLALIYSYYFGIRSTVLRIPNVYGSRAAISSPEYTFNNFFIGSALRNGLINVYGSGDQIRTLLHIKDLMTAVDRSLTNENTIGNTYIVAGYDRMPIKKIAEIIASMVPSTNVIGVPWPDNRRRIEVGDQIFSSKSFENSTGWQPEYKFANSVSDIIKFFTDNITHYLGE